MMKIDIIFRETLENSNAVGAELQKYVVSTTIQRRFHAMCQL